MGHLEVNNVHYSLPDGTCLLNDVSFRVGEGARAALVGANGSGKTTLTNIVSGQLVPDAGSVGFSGSVGVMPQFIGSMADDATVQDLLVSVAPIAIRTASETVARSEEHLILDDSHGTQMKYAQALADWGDAGGYEQEILWDIACTSALSIPYERARSRELRTLSGGEQKRLVLEVLLRGPEEVLILDEPDNYLDVPTKRWLETELVVSPKTVLFISHDRELISTVATKIITLEVHAVGNTAWVHADAYSTYQTARNQRNAKLGEQRRRWDEELSKLKALVIMYRQKAKYNSDMATRLQSAQTRLQRFLEVGPPEVVPQQEQVKMRLQGGRTAKRAVIIDDVELTGLMQSFTTEIWFGERVAVLGSNGSGKSHFLRLMAGGGSSPEIEHTPVGNAEIEPVMHRGNLRLGSRVRPGWFAQRHEQPQLYGRNLLDILHRGDDHREGLGREQAARALDRYGLARYSENMFEHLSGGQQARFQILLLELSGATLLLLDEPTDNLDLESVTALEQALDEFTGTVIAVTHDRWFAKGFDRFFIFQSDGDIRESDGPVWDENRVRRDRNQSF